MHFQPTGPAEDQTQKLILSTAIIATGFVLKKLKEWSLLYYSQGIINCIMILDMET